MSKFWPPKLTLNGIINTLLDLIFPRFCFGCGAYGKYICTRCSLEKLQKYPVHYCHVCRVESRKFAVHTDCLDQTYLDGVIVCFVYNDLLSEIVHEVKYNFSYAICGELAALMNSHLHNWSMGFDVITQVPLTKSRQNWRGFNQAELLASRIAKAFQLSHRNLLSRQEVKHNQVGLDKVERSMNLVKAFSASSDLSPEMQKVLIVDDVMTTGATLEQCARTLKNAGVSEVWGVVLARGI